MSIHVCRCEHNGVQEFHLRYPGMPEDRAQHLADKINAGWLDGSESPADRITALESELARVTLENEALKLLLKMRPTPQADMVPAEELERAKAEKDALREDAERLRDLLTNIRCDIQCDHWHKDIDAAIDAARKEGGCEVKIKGEKS